MTVFKSIVVGTDGSDRATLAVERALALARATGATLHVVHALPPAIFGTEFVDATGAPITRDDLREEGSETLARVVAEADNEGVIVQAHNIDGPPADGLIRIAESVDADLVVVGNLGMSGVRRFVLGSVPNKLSHHCPCSVLIVNTDPVQG
jgi:nucleotide-binding universal stress UspA family protein